MIAKRQRRHQSGASLVETVVGLLIIVIGTVFGALLLLNVGRVTYYKQKISFVAQQLAYYAAILPAPQDDPTVQPLLQTMGQQMIDRMGLNASTVTVNAGPAPIAIDPDAGVGVKVDLTVSFPTLLSAGFNATIPLNVTLSDSAVTAQSAWFRQYGVLYNPPLVDKVTFPVFEHQPLTGYIAPPHDGLPAWSMSIVNMWPIPGYP
ncbi:MAG: hypothetical protein JST44_07550 [Cyanobacteria bacterium SZAS LIN-5]|nr:hypothetical protein [Cyanobacteria bacterium SZAS LIN-5]RTL37657.1 MAG: hypothetical protein EKK48_23520 [Candidatus Melainabacteria bacterium]